MGHLKWILNDKVESLARHGIPRDEARAHIARSTALAAIDFAGENTPPTRSFAEEDL